MAMFGIPTKISFGRRDKVKTSLPPPSISSPIHPVQPPNRISQATFSSDTPANILNRKTSFDFKHPENRATLEFEPPPSYSSTISSSPRTLHYGMKNHRPLSQLSITSQLAEEYSHLHSTSMCSIPQNDSGSIQDVRLNHGLPSSSPKLHFPNRYSSKLAINLTELDMPKLVATIKPYSEVASRTVVLFKSETGDFGFSMNREDTDTIHILEPRNSISTLNGLLSGDKLIEVNNVTVESLSHDEVVNLIRQCDETVTLKVIAPPELLELALRGSLVPPKQQSKALPKRRKKSVHHRTAHANFIGTMRKSTVLNNRYSSIDPSDTPGMQWLSHKDGYCGVLMTEDTNSVGSNSATSGHGGYGRMTSLARSYSLFNDSIRVNIIESDHVLHVEQNDIEVAQTNVEGLENLAELNYLSEANCIHVLRTRFASSLIHTYAGRHLIVINPVRELKSYSERVMEMFRGCQKDDMPPHIFSVAQTAYNEMRSSRRDQTIILQGLSGSGKTYNARFIICYLSTIAAFPESTVTSDKFVAAGLLLLSFGSASTRINQQATRFTNFTTLNFDSLGRIISAVVTPYLLERTRVTDTPNREYTYNVIYQLILGANEALSNELMLSYEYSQDHPYINFPDSDSKDQVYLWSLIHDALPILEISEDEGRGVFSLIAAAYHLGHAGATSTAKGLGKFVLPAAAQNAATLLGTSVDSLQQEIFHHVNNLSSNGGVFTPNKNPASPAKLSSSSCSDNPQTALKWFIISLYEHAFHAIVLLINRALKGSSSTNKGTSFSINVIDMPGFQNFSEATATKSFDDLCHNYSQERLQMLFFDYSFTFELDKYHEEEVNFSFPENPISPLMVIDAIDKASHQPKYTTDKSYSDTESKGLFWLLDEESLFPNSDASLMDKLKGNFSSLDSIRSKRGPVVQVIDNSQFVVSHFQGKYPVTYQVTGWLDRIRENNLIRAVPTILNSSKRQCIACIFQNKGVAASSLNTSVQDGPLSKRYTTRRKSQVMAGISSSSKRNSVCLLTKFYLDYLIDEIRKTNQFFIRCIVPHPPENFGNVNLLDFDIPFVRNQFQCGELLKATRIYKQGYPESMHYPVFLRRFAVLNLPESKSDTPPTLDSKERSRILLGDTLQLDESKYKLGQSKIFFRVGTLHQLNSKIEEKTMNTFVLVQAYCRGYLARIHYEDLKLHDIATTIIQRNIRLYTELRHFSWWQLVQETKPLIQQSELFQFEEENKKLTEKLDTMTHKLNDHSQELESKRQSEDALEERVVALTHQLNNERTVSTDLQSILSNEKMANRELHAKVLFVQEESQKLKHENNSLKEENTKLNIKQARTDISNNTITSNHDNDGMDSQAVTRLKIEFEEAEARRRKAESECKSLEDERSDLQENLNKMRSRLSKATTELTDARIYGEDQCSKFLDIDKKQKKHELELSIVKESAEVEKQAREKLSREKTTLEVEIERFKDELETTEDARKKLKTNLDDMLFKSSSSSEDHHEISELKRQKNSLEIKIENLEEENSDLQIQVNRSEKEKSRLELENQNITRINTKENDNLQEELDNTRSNYIKKVRNLEQQLEEELEAKNNLLSSKRDVEDELQRCIIDIAASSANLQKMKKKVAQSKALLDDSQTELKVEREKNQRNKLCSKDLHNQVEELQNDKQTVTRNLRNTKQELEDLQESAEQHHIIKQELESQLADLNRVKDDLETQLEDLEDDSKTMQDKLSLLSLQLKESQNKNSQQLESIVNLTDDKDRLESKVQDLEHQLLTKPDVQSKPVNSVTESKLRDIESKLDIEVVQKKKLEKQNAKLTSQIQKLQLDLEKTKENDNTKKLQNEVKKLRANLEEAELKEEDAHKKKRDVERSLEDKESELIAVQDELRTLQLRSDKLRKAMETGNESQEDFGPEDETSTSFEDSPHIPSRHGFTNKRHTHYGAHNFAQDYDLHAIAHRYQLSDPMDSDDNLSVRSTQSRNSSRTHEYDGVESTSKTKTYSPNSLEFPKTGYLAKFLHSDNASEDGKLSIPTIDSELDDLTKTSSSRPSSVRSHERQPSIPEEQIAETIHSPSLPRPPLDDKRPSDDSSNTSSPSGSIPMQIQPPPLPAKMRSKSSEKRKSRQQRTFQQEKNNI